MVVYRSQNADNIEIAEDVPVWDRGFSDSLAMLVRNKFISLVHEYIDIFLIGTRTRAF